METISANAIILIMIKGLYYYLNVTDLNSMGVIQNYEIYIAMYRNGSR